MKKYLLMFINYDSLLPNTFLKNITTNITKADQDTMVAIKLLTA